MAKLLFTQENFLSFKMLESALPVLERNTLHCCQVLHVIFKNPGYWNAYIRSEFVLPSPRSTRFGTKFIRIVIKIFEISLPSQPFLGCHLGFHIIFHNGATQFFYSWLD